MISQRRALDLLSCACMPWRHAQPVDLSEGEAPWSWTGDYLLVTKDRTGTDLIHEICHWLVADPERRSLPEYGLGSAPWPDVHGAVEIAVTRDDAHLEEYSVSLLDVYLHALLQGQWRSRAAAVALPTKPRSLAAFLRHTDPDDDVNNREMWRDLTRRKLPARAREIARARP